MMDPHSLRPPVRRRTGREGDQAVLEAGDAAGGARAPSGVGESHLHRYSGWRESARGLSARLYPRLEGIGNGGSTWDLKFQIIFKKFKSSFCGMWDIYK